MTRSKQCRIGHAMTGDNVRKQTNRSTRASGKVVKYVTRVCVACKAYRAKRKAAGKPVKDMRRDAR